MNGVISIFLLPFEVEDFTITLSSLKRNSFYLDKDVKIKLDITLCLSDELTDWNNSKLPKQYFEDRIKELLNAYTDWCEYDLNIEHGVEIIGCLSHRRLSWKKHTDADFFIWLDTDICFKDITLSYMVNSYKVIKENKIDLFIVTPQIIKQWDSTWDVLVNKKFLNKPMEYQNNADIYTDIMSINDEINVVECPTFKFAGGWFTLISKKLFDIIGLPESFEHYGPDDTFIMTCSMFLKQKGYPIHQFTMENLLVGEIYKYKINNSIRNYISSRNRKAEFAKIANDNFAKELKNFYERSYGSINSLQ